MRSYEWILAGYFVYVALISQWFRGSQQFVGHPLYLAVTVVGLLAVLAYGETVERRVPVFQYARDWIPLFLTLIAYREMNWFTPAVRDYHLELRWIEWDRTLLHTWAFQRAIEWLGWVVPAYLEFCYLLVYAVGPFAVAALYLLNRRRKLAHVLVVFELGTLIVYALFPYFPSDPPRVVFGQTDLPHIETVFRHLNLWILGGYGIHSSVFPSAHVSSAFSAAWALLLFVPGKKWLGGAMLFYAVSVAIAVIYGRYHYATDCLAGFGISLLALGVGFVLRRHKGHAER